MMAVKAATMSMLLLAMGVAGAAAMMSPPDAVDHHQPAAMMSPPDAVDHHQPAAMMSPPDAVDHHQPAAMMSPPDAVDHQPAAAAVTHPHGHGHGGHHRSRSQEEGDQSPLGKLTRCAGVCGEEVAACMVQCFKPLASGKGNPALTPICLLACTTAAMSCGTGCPNSIFNN